MVHHAATDAAASVGATDGGVTGVTDPTTCVVVIGDDACDGVADVTSVGPAGVAVLGVVTASLD